MKSSRLSACLCLSLIELPHQTGFTPGCIVLVNDTLLGCLIQGDHGLPYGHLGFIQLAMRDQVAGFFHRGPCSSDVHPIA